MPKYQEVSSKSSRDRSRARGSYPYSHNSDDEDENENEKMKEWEQVRCPICLDYPHNAVLLICSSHDNGCRAYMCNNTSSFLSSCLYQFHESEGRFSCPWCRGRITGEKVVDDKARRYMNSKPKACSVEDCGFTGMYTELMDHTSNDHSSMRLSEAELRRQRDWTRSEHERELQDVRGASGLDFEMGPPTGVEGITWERIDRDGRVQPPPRRTRRMRTGLRTMSLQAIILFFSGTT